MYPSSEFNFEEVIVKRTAELCADVKSPSDTTKQKIENDVRHLLYGHERKHNSIDKLSFHFGFISKSTDFYTICLYE